MLPGVRGVRRSSSSHIASTESILYHHRRRIILHRRRVQNAGCRGMPFPGRSPLRCVAMVNVDVSPSVILGVGLIGSGVSLWQIRQTKPWISKDYDVVISCISLLVGGILIFQGWRLDPLLLFGQLMTTGAALSFAVEALRLRNQVYEKEEQDALQNAYREGDRMRRFQGSEDTMLPPPPMINDDMMSYGGYSQPSTSMYRSNSPDDDEDILVYDTTVGDVLYEDDDDRYGRSPGTVSYGFESIGRRDEYGDDDDVDIENFYNRGSRNVPPYVDLGDTDDF